MSLKEALVADMAKVSPPATVVSLTVFGVGMSDVVLLLTAVYTVFMLYFLLRDKWWRQRGKH